MRLRRETGDFQIKATLTGESEQGMKVTWNSIRPGLSAEDLIGEVVLKEEDGISEFLVITGANLKQNGMVIFVTPNIAGSYDPATGKITSDSVGN